MTRSDKFSVLYHDCGSDGWAEYDARGIYLTRVCDVCRKAKLAKYRPEVLTDSSYYCDEDVDPD